MKNANRSLFKCFALAFLLACSLGAFAEDDGGCHGTRMKVDLVAQNNSGIEGFATLCITDEGIRGRIVADSLKSGNVYTAWFFYDAAKGVPPGRFDSKVPDEDDATFIGHVGGLHPASGSQITFEIFAHGPASSDPDVRAKNLLTPAGGAPAAMALFDIP